MRLLLDTCVISELRHPQGHPGVRARVEALHTRDLFLSVITLGELVRGVSLLPPGEKKQGSDEWLQALWRESAGRILPIDVETAQIWGEVTADARRRGRKFAVADGLIAATAIRHGLLVMTRNVADFEAAGVRLVS